MEFLCFSIMETAKICNLNRYQSLMLQPGFPTFCMVGGGDKLIVALRAFLF